MARVYLLRHGESIHNVFVKDYMHSHPETHVMEWWEVEDAFDPEIRDADLTEEGVKQAHRVQERVATLQPSLLLMSPLTRSLRTGLEACGELLQGPEEKRNSEIRLQVRVTPSLREHTYATCDLGSEIEDLCDKFPMFDEEIRCLPTNWWCQEHSEDPNSRISCREPWQKLQDRAEDLCKIIMDESPKQSNILVVGHAVLFYALTGEWMSNCEVRELDMNKLRLRCSCESPACCCEPKYAN